MSHPPFPQQDLLLRSYQGVPALQCLGCPGDCCVSPTMTAPEFVWMMRYAQNTFSSADLARLLSAPSREHFRYADNAFCRFQLPNGLCGNYEGRALACRLHGHEALRQFTEDMEFCDRHPPGNKVLQPAEVADLIELLRQALIEASLPYEEPYYLLSLNLECWIDFYFHPEWSADRPTLKKVRDYLDAYLDLPKLPRMPMHTTLGGKLNAIDRLQDALNAQQRELCLSILASLQRDFPSCASYYVVEAREIETLILRETT